MNGSNQQKQQPTVSQSVEPILINNSVPGASPLSINKTEQYSPAPQPPQRNHLRSSLARNNTVNNQSISTETAPIQQHYQHTLLNNATNVVAKLVYKSVGTGSVQSLNISNSMDMQHDRKLSV